jgi:heptaprenylglyceryl phosphate synthase
METIDPFANESESLQIDELTIENRTDKVSIYGSIDITRDQRGLELARTIKHLLDSIVERLSQEDLPESIPPPQNIDVIKNPFE